MKKLLLLLCLSSVMSAFAQKDSSMDKALKDLDNNVPQKPSNAVKIFNSLKLINANTVEMLHKGAMEFKVIHNFYDISGHNGGIHHFFGLDNAADVKIVFQIGLSDKLNIVAGRTRGDQYQNVTELWELGFKYLFMNQQVNDPSHPVSISGYVNTVVSAMQKNNSVNREFSYTDFSSRLSQLIQLMIARKFGKVSVQLSPTFVHTNLVVPGDDNSLFALGAAIRLPLTKNLAFIADYFHSFRSKKSTDSLNVLADRNPGSYDQYGAGYDVLGLGLEIQTAGHIFHLNFTNATNILENRFIPRTLTAWDKGQFRWGFTIARNFILFRDKKKK